MSYIDAYYKREDDRVYVVERDSKGQRKFIEYDARYLFYYPDARGKHRSIYGETLQKVQCSNWKEFIKEQKIRSNKTLYEQDINPVFRCLEENYLGKDAPKLNVVFFDIEVDFDPKRGYSTTDDPFMPITAITCYLSWTDQLVTFAVPPKTLNMAGAKMATERFENVMLFERESDMLDAFLTLIDDADILSGWNSEGYDIPYTVGRIQKVLSSDDTRRLCFWGEKPKKRTFEKYGREQLSYDLIGRVHLDLLELYRKYTYEERHSYRLDAIGEWDTISIWTAQGGRMELRERTEYPHSLGILYSAFTQRCGLKPAEEEYILMGMAAYGRPIYKDKIYRDFIDSRMPFRLSQNLHRGIGNWASGADPMDIAASIQAVTEEILAGLWSRAASYLPASCLMEGQRNLVFGGGVALNCAANSKLADLGIFDNIWIMPNPGDAGSSLGCIAASEKKHLNWRHPFLGHNIEGEYPVDAIIKELESNKMCGVANGRAEFGPRALGNRSFLADPRGPEVTSKLGTPIPRTQHRWRVSCRCTYKRIKGKQDGGSCKW